MLIDPSVNVVVFRIKKLPGSDTVAVDVETRADDGIQKAWNNALTEHGAKKSKVVEIYSDWSASASDEQFLRSEFPGVDFSYRFVRPESEDGWEEALESAMQELLNEARAEMPMGFTGEDADPMLLPVLRDDDELMETFGVKASLGAGLGFCLANVAMTSRETIGIEYVMPGNVEDSQDAKIAMVTEAFQNLGAGLKIEGSQTEDGDTLLLITHPLDHAASAICLPDFYNNACEWLSGKEFFVGIPNPGTLILARSDSPMVEELTSKVVGSDYQGSVALTPATFRLSGDGLERTASRSSA